MHIKEEQHRQGALVDSLRCRPTPPCRAPLQRGFTSGDNANGDRNRPHNATQPEKIPSGGVARSDGVGQQLAPHTAPKSLSLMCTPKHQGKTETGAQKQKTPLVSVIVIFFNEERFITETIESLLAQTYQNWELLLVDDGSVDRSPKIAKTYAAQDPNRIRYLTHPNGENKGMSATRNLGLQHVKGDYISFLDADDIWLSQKLSEQVNILQSHPEIGLVCGRSQWWYSWTGESADRDRDFIPALQLPLNTAISAPNVLMQVLKNEWAALGDVMIRRCAVDSVGGYEASFRGMYEDQAFHAKLCLRYKTWIVDTCWYRYRQHSASCCAIADEAGWLASRKIYLEWLEGYLRQQPLACKASQAKVEQYVARELWRYRAPLLFKLRGKLQRLQSVATALKQKTQQQRATC